MSDERKKIDKWLVKAILHAKTLFGNYGIPWSTEDECIFRQIRHLIQHQPEIDEMYVSEKIMETMRSLSHLSSMMSSVVYQEIKKKLDKLIREIILDARGTQQVPVVKIKAPIVKPDEGEKFPYECCEKCDRLIKQFACKGVVNAIECLYLLSRMKIKKKGD